MITTQLNYDLFFYSDVVLSKFRQSVMDNPTFMETARGGRYMFLDDFQYLQNRKSTTTTFWRCRNRRTCPATVATSNKNDEIINRNTTHNHPPEHAKIKSQKIVEKQHSNSEDEIGSQ